MDAPASAQPNWPPGASCNTCSTCPTAKPPRPCAWRIDFTYALALDLDGPGFHHSALSDFRDRLAEGERADHLLDMALARLTDAGLVRKGTAQRTRPDGTPWHPGQVSDWFARIARAVGLAPITLHGLRHGAASLALAAGADVKVVSAELGHSTTHFTQDTYQTVFPDVARAAAEATAALLRGAPPQAAGSASAGSPVSAG